MDIKYFWDRAVTYDEYIRHRQEIIENPKTEQAKEYLEYYKLGLQRMKRMMKTYVPEEDKRKHLQPEISQGRC